MNLSPTRGPAVHRPDKAAHDAVKVGRARPVHLRRRSRASCRRLSRLARLATHRSRNRRRVRAVPRWTVPERSRCGEPRSPSGGAPGGGGSPGDRGSDRRRVGSCPGRQARSLPDEQWRSRSIVSVSSCERSNPYASTGARGGDARSPRRSGGSRSGSSPTDDRRRRVRRGRGRAGRRR